MASLSTVRYSIRAPSDPAITEWTVRFSVLTMPVAPSGSAQYTLWPDNGNITLHQGRAFVFVRRFPKHVTPTVGECSAMTSIESCTLPSLPARECFLESGLRDCPIPGAEAITPLADGRFAIGGRSIVGIASANFTSLTLVSGTPLLGDSKLVAEVAHPSMAASTALLVCGVGYGRSQCEYRELSNLLTVAGTNNWLATGVVPRNNAASYGMLVANGSVYSGRYQLNVPGNLAVDANVFSRSLLTDITSWGYRYTNQGSTANNGQ